MIVQTTIYMTENNKLKINAAARRCGVSQSGLVVELIKQAVDNHHNLIKPYGVVRYQKKSLDRKWQRLHVYVCSRDYEYCLDLRKFCKMSVSLIIAISLELYLNNIMKNIIGKCDQTKNTDNYTYQNYIIIRELIKNVICWKIYWGLPEKTEHIITTSTPV